MTLFLPDFHVSLAILAPNHRICAILPRLRISHLSLERVFYKTLPRRITFPTLSNERDDELDTLHAAIEPNRTNKKYSDCKKLNALF